MGFLGMFGKKNDRSDDQLSMIPDDVMRSDDIDGLQFNCRMGRRGLDYGYYHATDVDKALDKLKKALQWHETRLKATEDGSSVVIGASIANELDARAADLKNAISSAVSRAVGDDKEVDLSAVNSLIDTIAYDGAMRALSSAPVKAKSTEDNVSVASDAGGNHESTVHDVDSKKTASAGQVTVPVFYDEGQSADTNAYGHDARDFTQILSIPKNTDVHEKTVTTVADVHHDEADTTVIPPLSAPSFEPSATRSVPLVNDASVIRHDDSNASKPILDDGVPHIKHYRVGQQNPVELDSLISASIGTPSSTGAEPGRVNAPVYSVEEHKQTAPKPVVVGYGQEPDIKPVLHVDNVSNESIGAVRNTVSGLHVPTLGSVDMPSFGSSSSVHGSDVKTVQKQPVSSGETVKSDDMPSFVRDTLSSPKKPAASVNPFLAGRMRK